MNGISIKALALAICASLGLDIASGMILTAMLGGSVLRLDMPEQELNAAFAALMATRAFLVWSLVLGTLSTVVGGYLAARLAKSLPYMNAFVFGVLGILFGAFTADDLPLWFNVLGFGLTLPAAVLGGHIAKREMKNFH